MAINPSQLTISYLKKTGIIVENVESISPRTFFRKDLFGCIDIVALWKNKIIGIQATSKSNHQARKKKILSNPLMIAWLNHGGGLEIFSWEPRKIIPKIEIITIEDFLNRTT
jgi:hypothetical protein